MLSVQINGEWVQADDQSLVAWMLDGKVEELTPTRDPVKSGTVCPLIESLQPFQLELLIRRIMERLPGMYVAGPDSVDLPALSERVSGLRGWNWADHLVRGRLDWLDAWLSELMGSFERAVKSYDAYLRGLAQEPVLRLLAYNNRGVLRIHLRHAEGIRDIARAAIPAGEGGVFAEESRLPAACFNLLNLLTRALSRRPLRDQAEDVLVDFMVQLPRRVRERCLGPDSLGAEESQDEGSADRRDDQGSAEGRTGPERDESSAANSPDKGQSDREAAQSRLRKRLKILKDSSFERFTRLVVYLADGAAAIAAGQDEPCTVEAVASQLQLWIFESARATTGGPRRSRLDRCAEAASLLYASDVPSSLVPGDGSISWVKQYADKALQLAEEYCRSAEYKLAESTLASLSDFLQGSHGDPAAEPLRKEIADHLGEVRRKAQAHAQLELYQTCTNLIQQASQFCRGTDLCQAEFDGAILLQRVQEAQERLENEDVSEGEARPLLGDLPRRIQGHLDRLRREDIERRIGVPREQLRANCPRDWREPVSREAYEALRKCQANDPHGLVEDWSVWRNRLDKHQAQYHFRQALADITNGGGDGHCAQEMLDQALGFDPCLTPASASLYCMLALRKLENPPEGLANTKTAILKTARELLQMEPLGPDAMWSPAVRTGLVQEACVLLERLIGAYHGLETELDGLWEALERGFAPAFAEAPPAVVREIRTVVDTCLKACPVHSAAGKSGIDPRNRLHVLQRTCQKVLLIAEGEERLHEGRPQDAKTLLGEGIESLARDGLAGNQDGQLFRRAVCALYLAGFGDQDPLYVQQRVLDELDRWVDRMAGPDHASECSVQHVAQRIADARERMSGPTHAEQTYAMDIVHK